MKAHKTLVLFSTVFFAGAMMPAHAAISKDDPEILVKEGKFYGDFRYRFENVDQDGFTKDATAHTIHTNFGFKTGVWNNFQALGELQFVQHLGEEHFNDTVNGKTLFPVIADPDTKEINQAWIAWSGLPDTTIKVGRQKVNLDNQRYIGAVGWRQNDQTFDAAAIINSSIPDLNLMYAHVSNVNRIFGDDHPLGDLDTSTHIIHASYKATDWLNATAYGYLWEVDLAPALSAETYGLRLDGKVPLDDSWKFIYELEAAKQSDYGNNTADYDENYYLVSPGITGHGLTVKLGYEELGGDGTNSFKTPLATLHKFNGWADKFLTTPAQGLEDSFISASYKITDTDTFLDNVTFKAAYHDFDGDQSGDFGSEVDLAVSKTFTMPNAEGYPFKKVNVLLKYADYDGEDLPYRDTDKFWFQVAVPF